MRVSGFSLTTYRLVLSRFRDGAGPAAPAEPEDEGDELKLWKVMQADGRRAPRRHEAAERG